MQKIDLSKLLLIDVETAPQESAFGLLSKRMQSFWEKKNAFGRYAELPPEETYFNRAGLFAEFGKVVCISAGYFYKRGGVLQLKIKSFTGENESEILKDFSKMLVEHFNSIERFLLCGHNITEFDVPFLSRRLLANSLPIPELLDLSGLKPWQVPHLDTMRFWKFGGL